MRCERLHNSQPCKEAAKKKVSIVDYTGKKKYLINVCDKCTKEIETFLYLEKKPRGKR